MREFMRKLRGAIAKRVEVLIDKITKFDKAVVNDGIAVSEIYFVDGSNVKYYRFMDTLFVSSRFSMAMIYIVGLRFIDFVEVK